MGEWWIIGLMIAYKLVKIRKDGSIGSLFINRSAKLPVNKWIKAKLYPRKGFQTRMGWHCLATPNAPHLKMDLKNGETRQFWKVEISSYEIFHRPESQGGKWFLAKNIRFIKQA